MSAKRVTVHNILLAADARDAAIAIQRDPSLAGASVITRESQLYGLMVDEWHITERAANMRDLNKMVRYLRARSALTETSRKYPAYAPSASNRCAIGTSEVWDTWMI